MDAERWQQINTLLDAVMELPPGEQELYIEKHCEGDPELREEVLSLLQAHGKAESFLEEPARDYAATLIDMADKRIDDPLVGKEIDGYRILDVLGRGGMGIVYKAEDVALSRHVALKMIDPALARDESFVRRFRSEARALARINSPHIVSVHALRQTEQGLFIVMEYVDGGTLTDRMQAGPVTWQQALPIIKQMLTALEHAHSVDIIHRDIKPSNIMISRSGMVKVTDFGLAKLSQPGGNRTVTQGIAGTLYYMSPEQVKGLSTLDHRSDLYSMGMTIYQMLAGELPIDRDSGEFAIMRAIVEETLPPPSKYRPGIPAEVSRAVMKALEKDPDKRYQTAAEMRAAFERLHEPAHEEATVVEAKPYEAPTATNRRPLLLGLGGAAVVLLGLLAWLLWPSAASTIPLSIRTNESGAMVYLNGEPIGATPLLEYAVNAGQQPLALRIEKDGFVPLDTTLVPTEGQPLVLFVALRDADDGGEDGVSVAYLDVRADPRDAILMVNGERVGPVSGLNERLELPPGEVRVEIRRSGYEPWSDVYELSEGQVQTIDVRLPPVSSNGGGDPEPLPVTATLTLDVAPNGTMSVQGETCVIGSPCTVRAGQKRVTFSHPVYGEQTETIRVNAGEHKSLTYHFEQEVVIQVRRENGEPKWGTIYVDGAEVAQRQDYIVQLGPGEHIVQVERAGHELIRVDKDGAQVSPGPQTISIEPGFTARSHRLVFYIRDQARIY